MALQNRENISLRWLALGYVSGLVGGILDLGSRWLPVWLSLGFGMAAAPVGYACFHACTVQFVRKGWRTRWISVVMLGAALPFFIVWCHRDGLSKSATLADFVLAVQTLLTVIVILSSSDGETRWPRRTIGAFLAVYSAVEFFRVAIFFKTGRMPADVFPPIEIASGIVYVVSCSVLPLAFIWMMNARLLSHLNRQALIDPLTELLNRRGIENAGAEELQKYRTSGREFAVALVDIDHFIKSVNDRFGHACGDQALRSMAAFLKAAIRPADLSGRIGGEEFVIVLPGVVAHEARFLVEHLRTGFREHVMELSGGNIQLTASFGIAVTRGRRELDWETLMREADSALYAAKSAGRNATRVHETALAGAHRES